MIKQLKLKSGWIDFILFILLALLWSGSFINIKIVVEQLPPLFCAMVRVSISFCCLSILFTLLRKKVWLPPARAWRLWFAGLFSQSLPFAFLFYGEKFIAPALASIINSTVSIWALILGTVIFRDLSQWSCIKVGGIILGFIGIILVFSPFLHGNASSLIGILSVTGMAVAYAIGGLLNQHVIFKNKQINFETNLVQQHLASMLFLLALSLKLEPWTAVINAWNFKIFWSFLYLGIMATALAWLIYFYLIREWGAVRAASVMYLVPVLAIMWDLLFLQLYPTKHEILGMIAILGGVTLIQWVRKPKANLIDIDQLQIKKV